MANWRAPARRRNTSPASMSRCRSAACWPRWSRWYWPFLAVLAAALIGLSYSTGKPSWWLEDNRTWAIGAVGVLAALLALGLNAGRWQIFATVVLALVMVRVYPSDEGRVET